VAVRTAEGSHRAVSDDFHSHVRLDNTERSKLLSRLDERPPSPSGRDRRRYKRWEYRRSDIAVLVQHPGGGAGRYVVCARNISAGGLSFIHGGYLHPGSECRIVLPRRDGTPQPVTGTIVHCRHVEGCFHEIGIRFAEELDPEALLSPAEAGEMAGGDQTLELPGLEGQVLVVDQSPADRKLLLNQLTVTGLALTMADSAGAALDAMRRREFAVVLCDLGPGADALRMIKQMRKAGYQRPIIVVTAETAPARLAEARAAGANEIIGKPCNPLYLASLLAEWMEVPPVDRPIYSDREDTPGMAELVLEFIEQAQRKAIQLQRLLDAGESNGLREICLGLAGSGGGHGFPSLTEAARDALTALDTSQARHDAEAPLRRLISICQRLRCANTVRPLKG
jgi:CheY-like chemotaxis protein